MAAGCSSRPYGTLVAGTTAPDASKVDLLVATTRAPVLEPPGVMFGGSRGRGLDFADIVVSIPPAGTRQPGDVPLPSSLPADPERDFVTLRADRMDLAQAKANFDARIRRTPGRRVLIFVHGFNTRFEEAVYRFAQIVYDARVNVAPVLFTWPSGGNVTDYVYDRDSAMYSRDALEAVLQTLVKDPNVDSISILAHSMGNYIVVESLRQMSIRNRGLSPKIQDVMLASPDIDVDVFRRQIAEIDAGPRPAQFTLFLSRDDRALGLSSFLARDFDQARRARSQQGAISFDPGAGQSASHRLDRHGLHRLHQPWQIRQWRSCRCDWGTPGGGPELSLKPRGAWSNRLARLRPAPLVSPPGSQRARSPRRARCSIRRGERSRSTPRRKPRL